MKSLFFLLITNLCLFHGSSAAKFPVTNTAETGPGSFRQAINDANATVAKDTIEFNIADIASNYFEGVAPARFAVIRLTTALPTLFQPLFINGSTQANSNTGFIAGKTVGADHFTQEAFQFPDIYIIPTYTLPANDVGKTGNGLSVGGVDIKIVGLAISGFGNKSTSQPTGVGHADISVLRSTVAKTMNVEISNCFLSCDPLGNFPAPSSRVSKGGGIVVLGNNNVGLIDHNYIAHCGGYGIVFHGTIDNASGTTLKPSQNWTIEENQIIDIGTNSAYTAANGRAADGISMMNTLRCKVQNNYVSDFEQMGIDLGHNTDDNLVQNNTITGLTKTTGSLPVAGMRVSFSSQRDTIRKNEIFNNTSPVCLGGIWLDESGTSFSGSVLRDNIDYLIVGNQVYNNTGSGIVLSNNGNVALNSVTISANSIYNNTGLGIDLNFNGTTGPTAVTLNDNGDTDAGTNGLQNFPIIDSARLTGNNLTVWGKGPAASKMEFFVNDGGINKHSSNSLNYGEGKFFLDSAVEGSVKDLAAGTKSYVDIDNNNETAARLFKFTFTLSASAAASIGSTDSLTATATVNKNTSEFGPFMKTFTILHCDLINFKGSSINRDVALYWNADCDNTFSHFQTEYSVDGVHFLNVGKEIYSLNNVSGYGLNHTDPLSKGNFYRLKLVSKDGSYRYSNVIFVAIKQQSKMSISPNPASGNINATIVSARAGVARIILFSSNGIMVFQQDQMISAGNNSIRIPGIDRFSKGLYTVQVVIDKELFTEMLLIQK